MAEGKDVGLTVLGGIIGALITAYATIHNGDQTSEIEQQKVNQQLVIENKRLQLDLDKARESAIAKANEDFRAKKLSHAQDVKKAAAALKGQYWILTVDNPCEDPIQLAFHYVALDGAPVTEGWWTVPGRSSAKTISTASPVFYFYGKMLMPHQLKQTPQDQGPRFPWIWAGNFALQEHEDALSGGHGGMFIPHVIDAKHFGNANLKPSCDLFTNPKS
jgi:hypothetical protein